MQRSVIPRPYPIDIQNGFRIVSCLQLFHKELSIIYHDLLFTFHPGDIFVLHLDYGGKLAKIRFSQQRSMDTYSMWVTTVTYNPSLRKTFCLLVRRQDMHSANAISSLLKTEVFLMQVQNGEVEALQLSFHSVHHADWATLEDGSVLHIGTDLQMGRARLKY